MFHRPTKWGFALILCLVCCTTRAADQSGEQPVNVVLFLADCSAAISSAPNRTLLRSGKPNRNVFPGRMIRSKKFKYIRNYNAMEVVERKRAAGEIIDPFIQMGAKRHRELPEEELYRVDEDPGELWAPRNCFQPTSCALADEARTQQPKVSKPVPRRSFRWKQFVMLEKEGDSGGFQVNKKSVFPILTGLVDGPRRDHGIICSDQFHLGDHEFTWFLARIDSKLVDAFPFRYG